jgi:uncharacterized protein YceK
MKLQLFALSIAVVMCSGCATPALLRIGKTEDIITKYEEAYIYKQDLVLSYLVDVRGPRERGGVLGELLERDRSRWASLSVDRIREAPPYSNHNTALWHHYRLHTGSMPGRISANGSPVPIVMTESTDEVNNLRKQEHSAPYSLFMHPIEQRNAWSRATLVIVDHPSEKGMLRNMPMPRRTHRPPWAYPVMVIGFPVAIVADTLMVPVYILGGLVVSSAMN